MDDEFEGHEHPVENRTETPILLLGFLVPFGIFLLGLPPRIAQYLDYRALSHDEAVLAYNIVSRPVKELFGPFGDSMAPAGYMLLTRAATIVSGANEYAVRFVPFAAGILSLTIFYPVARRFSSVAGAAFGLAFLAVGKEIIFFGDYVRPYSSDVFWTLVAFAMALYLDRAKPNVAGYALCALTGAVAVWMSFPVLFVLVGVAVAQLVYSLLSASVDRAARVSLVYCAWAVSFIVLYAVTIAPIREDAETMNLMNDYYQYAHAFMPMPPTSYAEFQWFNWNFIHVFENPGGMTLPGLAAFAAVVGAISLVNTSAKHFLFVAAPVLVALVVSGFERYPFWERTILYLTPIIYLLMGEGVAFLMTQLRGRAMALGVVLFVMLITVPGFRAARLITEPTTHHELDVVLDHAQERWKKGDLLYIHSSSWEAFYFCKERYTFPEDRTLVEPEIFQDDPDHAQFIAENMANLAQRERVWVALTYDVASVVQPFVETLEAYGARIDEFHARGASVYLYTFKLETAEPPPE